MRRSLLTSLRMALVTAVLVGMVYPLTVWAISRVAFPRQASGSLVTAENGRIVGSRLIGQAFSSDRYFHGRPSAAGSDGYDAMASGASNLGPTNGKLVAAVRARATDTAAEDGLAAGKVPVDLVTASASGLDPDISPDAAYAQVARIAEARGLPNARVRELVRTAIAERQLGFLGERRVHVLELNLALDAIGGAR